MNKTLFCTSFPWKRKIKWFDLEGVTTLDSDRRATIELATHGYSQHYDGFNVRVISKTSGQIASKTFLFADYLDARKRKDNRTDHREGFKVISYVSWGWYIAIPADTTPIVTAIEDWIKNWI